MTWIFDTSCNVYAICLKLHINRIDRKWNERDQKEFLIEINTCKRAHRKPSSQELARIFELGISSVHNLICRSASIHSTSQKRIKFCAKSQERSTLAFWVRSNHWQKTWIEAYGSKICCEGFAMKEKADHFEHFLCQKKWLTWGLELQK